MLFHSSKGASGPGSSCRVGSLVSLFGSNRTLLRYPSLKRPAPQAITGHRRSQRPFSVLATLTRRSASFSVVSRWTSAAEAMAEAARTPSRRCAQVGNIVVARFLASRHVKGRLIAERRRCTRNKARVFFSVSAQPSSYRSLFSSNAILAEMLNGAAAAGP